MSAYSNINKEITSIFYNGNFISKGYFNNKIIFNCNLVTFTINPTPNDANVTFSNYEAGVISSDGKSIIVKKGSNITWSVSKENYISQSGNYTVINNYILPVTLQQASTDYEYTVQGDDTAILTKYIGTNPVVIGPDYVGGDL